MVQGDSLVVLGLDSATRAGYGLVEKDAKGERVLEKGLLDLSGRSGKRADVIEDFARRLLARAEIDVVGIEDNYLDTSEGKENVVTLKTLARLAGRFEQSFEAMGVETVLVNPQRWQVGILRGLIGPRSKRDERKKAAGLWVRATFGIAVEENEGDAIGIATFLARSRAFARKTGQAA